jgi:pyridoxamine 5'-phosphate oxidase family protein
MAQVFTDHELDYLRGQRLARLATLAPDGTLQNNPVAFFVHASAGTVDVGGGRILRTRKFRNVQTHPQVALVIDDLASVDPWRPRCLEIRGRAEALPDAEPPARGFSRGVIRIHPETIFSFGIDPDGQGMSRRTIAPVSTR